MKMESDNITTKIYTMTARVVTPEELESDRQNGVVQMELPQ